MPGEPVRSLAGRRTEGYGVAIDGRWGGEDERRMIVPVMGRLGLLRIAVRRLRGQPTTALVSGLLVLVVASVLAAGVVYADAIADGSLRRSILARSPEEQRIQVRLLASVEELADLDAVVRSELERAVARANGRVSLAARTVVGIDGPSGRPARLSILAGDGELVGRATLVAGRWPTSLVPTGPDRATPVPSGTGTIEVAVPMATADELGLELGDRLTVGDRRSTSGNARELLVVGFWRPEASASVWAGAALAVEPPAEAGGTLGPAIIGLSDLAALAGSVDLEWSAVPDLAALRAADAESLAADIAALATRLPAALPRDRAPLLTLALGEALRSEGRVALVGRAGVLIVTVELAALSLYGLLLLSALLAERRIGEAILLRARGASVGHLFRVSILEASLVALPALVVGPAVAVGVVHILGSLGLLASTGIVGLTTPDVVLAGVAAAATTGFAVAAIGVAAPGPVVGASLAAVRARLARARTVGLAVRLGFDIVLVAAAAVAFWQIGRGGGLLVGGGGSLHPNLIVVAGPAVGLLAGATVALRVVPLLMIVGQWAASRRRGAVVTLAARQLARRPLRFARVALLLVLAVGLATLASAYVATWDRSQRDQAAYESAVDLRIVAADYPAVPDWLSAAWYGRLEGVTAVGAVTRGTFDAGRGVRDAELLAIEPEVLGPSFGRSAGVEDAALAAALDALRSGRLTLAALELPSGTTALRIAFRANLTVHSAGELGGAPSDETIELLPRVRLLDGHGRLVQLDGPSVDGSGGEQVVEIPLAGSLGDGSPSTGVAGESGRVAPTPPLRLIGIEVQIRAAIYLSIVGTFEIVAVDAVPAASGEAVVPLDVPPPVGWSWTRLEPSERLGVVTEPYPTEPGAPGRISLVAPESPPVLGGPRGGPGGLPERADRPVSGAQGTTFVLAAELPSQPILPAILGRSLAERAGVGPGDLLPIDVFGFRARLRVASIVDRLPPLDPNRPFAVVDAPSLELVALAATRTGVGIDEWWLVLRPGAEAVVSKAVAQGPSTPAEIVGREAGTASRLRDPVALGLIGALTLASLASLVFAAVGVVVGALVGAEERLTELAVLRALGLSRTDLVGWLVVEQAALIATGIGAGLVVGLILAVLVLPSLTLTPAGPPVPPVVIVLPWPTVGLLVLAGPALLIAVAGLLRRQTSHLEVATTIRATEI